MRDGGAAVRSAARTRLRWFGLVVLVAAAYYAGARLGLRLAFLNRNVTAVWPPTGIAVAALVLGGRRMWPGVAAGAFFANLLNGLPPPTAAGIAVGNTLAPLAASLLLDRIAFRRGFDRTTDVAGLVFGAGLGCMMISATLGTATLALAGAVAAGTLGSVWLVWWIGDAMGVVVLAPLLIIAFTPGGATPVRKRPLEAAAALITAMALARIVFGSKMAVAYVLFVFLIWAAVRLEQVGAAMIALGVASIATWQTVQGHGPFVGSSITGDLLNLQGFNGTVSLTGMVLAAVIKERERARAALQSLATDLEERVRLRTAELEAAERLARETSARLAEAQALAHIGSWFWDVERDTVEWSDELYRIYGLPPGSPIDYGTYVSLLHPDDRGDVQNHVREALEEGRSFEFRHRVVRPDGAVRWAQGRGAVVRGPDGSVTALMGTSQDVTGIVEAEEALREALERERAAAESLREADRLKDEFLATVSHEMRTPLAAVVGFIDLLRTGWDRYEESRRREILDRAARSSREMANLIEQLLDFSRLAAGKGAVYPRVLDAGAAVRRALDVWLDPVPERVILDLEEDVRVVADPYVLERVLGNLVSNALKFSPEDAPVTIRTVAVDGSLEVSVTDRGPGIPEDERHQIFERFYRGSTVAAPGSGIGLAIVARYMELTGTRLDVETSPQGSTFRFTLPLAGPRGSVPA